MFVQFSTKNKKKSVQNSVWCSKYRSIISDSTNFATYIGTIVDDQWNTGYPKSDGPNSVQTDRVVNFQLK